MKVNNIINAETRKNLYSLLKTMDSKTKTTYYANGCGFNTVYTTGAIIKGSENGVFGGGVLKLANFPKDGTSTVRLNGKEYTIDNLTGKVKQKEFSFIRVSKKTVKSISNLINKLKENFENPEVVEQYNWGLSGMTEKGSKIWQENLQKFYETLKANGIKTAEDLDKLEALDL